MIVRFRDAARNDLKEILTYIAKDNPAAARDMVARLRARAQALERSPSLGRMRPELGPGVQSLVERPYVILFRAWESEFEIIGVLHMARDLPAIVQQRLL